LNASVHGVAVPVAVGVWLGMGVTLPVPGVWVGLLPGVLVRLLVGGTVSVAPAVAVEVGLLPGVRVLVGPVVTVGLLKGV
jgi:hypothetical protein